MYHHGVPIQAVHHWHTRQRTYLQHQLNRNQHRYSKALPYTYTFLDCLKCTSLCFTHFTFLSCLACCWRAGGILQDVPSDRPRCDPGKPIFSSALVTLLAPGCLCWEPRRQGSHCDLTSSNGLLVVQGGIDVAWPARKSCFRGLPYNLFWNNLTGDIPIVHWLQRSDKLYQSRLAY